MISKGAHGYTTYTRDGDNTQKVSAIIITPGYAHPKIQLYTGSDDAARELLALLKEAGIDCESDPQECSNKQQQPLGPNGERKSFYTHTDAMAYNRLSFKDGEALAKGIDVAVNHGFVSEAFADVVTRDLPRALEDADHHKITHCSPAGKIGRG